MIIGIDEAGRGPILGPMVIAAVAVDDDEYLREIGVRDSKTYTPGSRERTFSLLESNAIYSVEIIRAEEIDRKRKEMTLNEIEVKAFVLALGKIYEKVSPGFNDIFEMICASITYVDSCDVNEERFAKNIAGTLIKTYGDVSPGRDREEILGHIVSKHKADVRFPVVSAASVIAKTFREREVRKMKEALGEDFGSGYPSDPRTRDYLEDYYRRNKAFPPYTRKSWNTVNKIIKKVSTTTLNGFL